MQHADSITSVSLRISVHYTRASANAVDENLVLPDGITLTPGRPEIADMLSAMIGCASALKNTTTEGVHGVVVGSCGPEELMANIRRVEHAVGSKVRGAVGGVELVEEYVSSRSRGVVALMLTRLFPSTEPLLGDPVGPRQTSQTPTTSHNMFLFFIFCVDRIHHLSSHTYPSLTTYKLVGPIHISSTSPTTRGWAGTIHFLDQSMRMPYLYYLDTVHVDNCSKSSSFQLFAVPHPFCCNRVPYDLRSVTEYMAHRPPKYIGGGIEYLLLFMTLRVAVGRRRAEWRYVNLADGTCRG